jgi:Leucine zipper with capping helix domain
MPVVHGCLSCLQADRAEKLKELAELKAEKEALDTKLKAFADSDPESLKTMEENAKNAIDHVNRWTDNVWAVKSYLVNKYGKAPSEVDALMGIPDDFDYIKK